MKKHSFIDLKNNKIAIKYLIESREGNKSSQRHLYEALKEFTNNYLYSLWYRYSGVGLTYQEVYEEFTYCYMQLLEKFDETLGIYLLRYFNVLLYKRVKAIHKRAKCVTRRIQASSNGQTEDYFSNGYSIKEIDYDENKKRIDDSELSNIILGPTSKILDDEEKYVFEFLTQSYSIREIAKISKMKYSQCLKKYKTGISKIRHYLKRINLDENANSSASTIDGK